MSRGLGWVERAILAALAEVPGASASTKTLVATVFGTAPAGPCIPHGATTTQVASVARAVRSLARKGLVVTSPSNTAHRRRQVRARATTARGSESDGRGQSGFEQAPESFADKLIDIV
jgi:hypothetical protein